jgi:acetyl esterase
MTILEKCFRLTAGIHSLALVAILSGTTLAAEQTPLRTSENDAQLKKWLASTPAADADKDGVLTMEEATTWLKKQRANRPNPDRANVAYGKHERQVLDFYQAESDQPTPLVIYIHGGGFVAGNKNGMNAGVIRDCLKAGISCAAIHYRFVRGELDVSACMMDGARAVQFLRSMATEWNIDPFRFAAYGGSAGAGISLWLGFHDDLCDPDNADPVLRQSSRLSAVGSFGGQSTYDPRWIKAEIGGRAWEHPSLFMMFNMAGAEDLNNPKYFKLYEEVSAITHLTKDDTPVFMYYNEADGVLPEDARPGQGIHHPKFGHMLKKEMESLGLEAIYRHKSESNRPNPNVEMVEFFKKYLGVQ